jgi:hypothetical protein
LSLTQETLTHDRSFPNTIMPSRSNDEKNFLSSSFIVFAFSSERYFLSCSLCHSINLEHRRFVWNIPTVCVLPVLLLESTSIQWPVLELIQYPSRKPNTAAIATHSRLALMNSVIPGKIVLNPTAICARYITMRVCTRKDFLQAGYSIRGEAVRLLWAFPCTFGAPPRELRRLELLIMNAF